MVKKQKTAKGTAQKIGNPPKHPQFGKARQSKRPAKGFLSTYFVKAARDRVFATARRRSRTISGPQPRHATVAISVLRIRWP